MRKRKNINILKIIGHSDSSIIIPCLINTVIISIISTIFASFADIVTVKKLLPDITQNTILNGITYNMVQVFLIYVIRYMRLMGAGFLNELFTKMSKTAVYKLQIFRCHLIINPVYLL